MNSSLQQLSPTHSPAAWCTSWAGSELMARVVLALLCVSASQGIGIAMETWNFINLHQLFGLLSNSLVFFYFCDFNIRNSARPSPTSFWCEVQIINIKSGCAKSSRLGTSTEHRNCSGAKTFQKCPTSLQHPLRTTSGVGEGHLQITSEKISFLYSASESAFPTTENLLFFSPRSS